MQFVPRSQQTEQAAAPQPSMAVVENRLPPPSATTANADEQAEQISELNELLVHVLDEISSLKDAIYQNTRRDSRKKTRGAKSKRRHVTEESDDDESGESETEPEMTDNNKGRDKKSAATAALTTTHPRRGIDFSNCF